MKPRPIPLITAALLCCIASFVHAQKGGNDNISPALLARLDSNSIRVNGRALFQLQFDQLPDEQERQRLSQSGVTLLDFLGGNAYTVEVRGSLKNNNGLKSARLRAILPFEAESKMRPALAQGIFPAWATRSQNTAELWISFPKTQTYETVASELIARNFDIVSTSYRDYRIIGVSIAQSRLKELASLPFIDYVQVAPKEDELLNNKTVAGTRANVLRSLLPGQRGLLGEGVVIGIGDDADPLNHIDFVNRVIYRTAAVGGSHGMHVTGIVAGAGTVEERYAGYAPKATVISQLMSGILVNAPAYVQDHHMVITNNSYGNITNDCATFGVYDLYSRVLDQQAFQMPNLQQVFATGNSGAYNCGGYVSGFGNVLGGYQTAKNTISVANISELGAVQPSSSKGPVKDGRIKPEISAQGLRVVSTWPSVIYSYGSGTSMASPAVAGGLGLLYQRYRQLHANADPQNALMKALILNGATDIGNPGPDYSYGFGWMNLLRSVTMLEKNNYIGSSVTAGGTNTHSITIPPGATIAQLKVMLYWNDSAAAVFASHALVNDLDLEVSNPSATVIYPQLLDTTRTNVNQVASTGVDHINNVEQVVITNPVSGTYTFTVKGTTIPLSPQQSYYLVYDTIPVSTTLTYPIGGERFRESDSLYISWDSYGNPGNDFNLEYSLDNGATWIPIATNIAANIRQYNWHIPAAITAPQAKVRITQNGTGIVKTSEAFIIVGVPVPVLDAVQCEGYIAFSWPAITGATDYEVMLLRGGGIEMTPVGVTTSTSYKIGGLQRDSLYFFTVRARIGGQPGRRATALYRFPNTGTCAGSISDNDMKVDALTGPISGRKLTATELTSTTDVSIRIKNIDDIATVGNIPVTYIIGANPPVTETIIAPNIAAGATLNYTFTTKANLATAGVYNLKVSVSYAGDPVKENDTVTAVIKQLDNLYIDLTSDFLDNLETATEQSYTTRQIGLTGLDRYDFVGSTVYGRIRTFVNTGISYSGSKAITLDADRYVAAGNIDSLTGTFNLQGYDANLEDLRLDFQFKHHGQVANAANNVWVRGSDQGVWIPAYNLTGNQADRGIFKQSASIELSDLLVANGQVFTSSFQAKWGQWGQILTADNESAAGYTFDDIRLYKVLNDIQMIRIDTPVVASCGLTNAVPVRITIRNSANTTISSIPVSFKIDNLAPVTEIIGSIAGNTTTTYLFTATADLSAQGVHTVRVWSDLTGDSYHANDSATVVLNNAPLVTSFPYLQDFESTNGGWYAAGKKSSWEYGTPASVKINRAASGSKAWKTRLIGNYNDLELSYLYSPCFDISAMTTPTLSFAVALDLEDCGASLCDATYMEYSGDGITWTRLGTVGAGTNWYNRNYAGSRVWSIQDYTRWHVATIPLPTGFTRLRVRFVMQSDPYVSKEGIAIDDIHIYDNTAGIYKGPPYTSAVSNQPAVSGSSWIHFTDGGKLIASVNPNGQNLGNTDAQAYIYTAAVRAFNSQYYHHRNITIKPANVSLADSVSVRFYFLDTETDTLIKATGCANCFKPRSAYELGVSKYSDATVSHENGTITDNLGGHWSFINPTKVRIVPFDAGYYAEFKVRDFSEFWLNNGGIDNLHALPVTLLGFTAKKQVNRDVLVEWRTSAEVNVDRYEVEVARGNEDYRLNHYSRIAQRPGFNVSGSEQYYSFTDVESNKSGVRYYRLKMIDRDGRFTYSPIRPVVFNEEVKWQVYPNPTTGIFNLVYQVSEGEIVQVKIHDMGGRLVKQFQLLGNGFMQKSEVDLSGSKFSSGLYLVEASSGTKTQNFRVLKK